jgi:hypothetical protein
VPTSRTADRARRHCPPARCPPPPASSALPPPAATPLQRASPTCCASSCAHGYSGRAVPPPMPDPPLIEVGARPWLRRRLQHPSDLLAATTAISAPVPDVRSCLCAQPPVPCLLCPTSSRAVGLRARDYPFGRLLALPPPRTSPSKVLLPHDLRM